MQAEHSKCSDKATVCKTDGPWFDPQKKHECFLVHETCQQDMKPTQSTTNWVLGIKFRGLKLTKISYIQDEVQAVYSAILSTFCTGTVLHSLIANKKGDRYGNTWVH